MIGYVVGFYFVSFVLRILRVENRFQKISYYEWLDELYIVMMLFCVDWIVCCAGNICCNVGC